MAHYPWCKQYLGVAFYLANFLALSWAWPLLILFLCIPITTLPALGYLVYILATNYSTALLHGYTKKPLVTWQFWAWMADYFSYSLVKTAPLPADRPYLLCCSPHGVFSFGAAISTSSIGFEKTFPGLDTHISTLRWNFSLPFGRELLHMWGAIDCSFDTLVKTLQRGAGSAVVLEVGGTQESLHCHRGTYDLVLDKRRGFVRVAMAAGASIVPVLFFGEPDTYEVTKAAPGSLLDRFQKLLMRTGGFTMPIFTGRLAVFPYQAVITGVVGAPIAVRQFHGDLHSAEANALVDKYHAAYKTQVLKLWDKYKDVYAKNRVHELRVVE